MKCNGCNVELSEDMLYYMKGEKGFCVECYERIPRGMLELLKGAEYAHLPNIEDPVEIEVIDEPQHGVIETNGTLSKEEGSSTTNGGTESGPSDDEGECGDNTWD